MDDASGAALAVLRRHAAVLLTPPPRPVPLRSIFSEVAEPGNDLPAPAFYTPSTLRIDRASLFPTLDPEQALSNADPDLAQRFSQAYRDLPGDDEPALEQLYYLLQEYAWAIPSAHDDAVSLFDQARTEAAVAAVHAADNGADGVLLVGGDISGVQAFLYTLTAAGATRGLRARSFYLQLLTDAIAHYLLRQAGLPLVNLLYSGGGRFYVVLPRSAEAALEGWRQELGQWMLRRHKAELYVALGAVPFDEGTLADTTKFQAQWRVLGEAINVDKRRKFADLGPEALVRELFTPHGHGGNSADACVVCRFQGEPDRELVSFTAREEAEVLPSEQQSICLLCDSFNTLARELHNARYLLVMPLAPNLPRQRQRVAAHTVLQDLGMDFRMAHSEAEVRERMADAPPGTRVLALHEPVSSALRLQLGGRGIACGIRPMVNETPTVRERDVEKLRAWLDAHPDEQEREPGRSIKTFGMLVAQSKGVKRLGVLRMDVDDLGDLFAHSLQRSTLARIGGLSSALVRFFEGWVGELCRQVNADAERGALVYAVYSGGDDLFIVGSWHVLPELARSIREDLRAYARNECVHISAGLSLHGAKFPLYQAAEAAHKELERAKERPGKDAFGLLDHVIPWGPTGDDVFELTRRLTTYIDDKRLSRSVLQALQAIYGQYLKALNDGERRGNRDVLVFGPWIWRGVYQLARIVTELGREEQDVAGFIRSLSTRLLEGADTRPRTIGRFIERVGFAARWAQLLVREEQR